MRIESKLKATVMAVALATIPVALHAAGLGRLNVLSGLGQPLRAEIDLVAVQPAEVESLRAALAAPEAYREAQIDYPSTALGLRFNLEKRSNGQYFIAVNSAQSVNEPFLDFLLELKWDGGRVLREYTALLDPVGYNASTPVRTVAPAQPANNQPLPKPVLAPKPAVESKPAQPKPETKPVEAKPEAKSEPKAVAESDSTHTVKPGETLAGIARQTQVEGVSLDQMLVGLYRANQGAFDGNNMNRLKRGRILSIPSKEALSAIDPRVAAQEVKVQADDWRSYRAKLAAAAPVSQGDEAGGSGKIVAKVDEPAVARELAGKDSLKLSKGEEGKLRERVQTLEEESVARQKALQEANQRVAELEKTNKKLEDLLALKSKQGAELQKQAAAASAVAPAEPQKPLEPATETKPAEAAVSAEVAPPNATAPEAAPAAPVVAPPPAEKPKKKRPPVIIEEPEPEPSLLENPLVLGGGGLLAVLLGGGAFWALRRRKSGNFSDSVITGSDLKSNTMVGNTGGAVISTGVTENSFLTDFSRAGLGTIDTDEVDPIAEAEVYMAYGRDAQAEEILKDALVRDGSRQEVRLKLLEIYAARKNPAAFETAAQELYSASQGQGAVWAQAAEMGRVLDPSNSLYQQQAPVDTGSLDKTMIMSAGTLGEMMDTGKFDTPVSNQVAAELDDKSDLDFQLDSPVKAEPEAAPAMDFDLDMPAVAVEEPAASDLDFQLDTPAPSSAPAAADDDILSLDIPLELGNESPAAAPAADDFGLQLNEAALSMPELNAMPAELASSDLASDLDFDFDLNEAAAPAAEAPLDVDGMSLDLDIAPEAGSGADIADFSAELDDPVTTKIDLARAYIDMGDKEGAREILQEAMSEGNTEQKSTAESLLAQL